MGSLRAAGFIICRKLTNQFEYLLMQASYEPYHWSPPKGHVDPGEEDMQTALRETEEEAGLKVNHLKITDFRKELHYVVRNKSKTVVYWLAELIDPVTPVTMSHEHKDYRWLMIEDACKIAQFLDMQDLLLECDNYLKASSPSVSN